MFSSINTTRVLVIGDLHTPFEHADYLAHCKQVAKKYRTNHTVVIGDIVDNHFSSFHETNPDGYGAGAELQHAIDRLEPWHRAFPNADYILGNHCKIIERKLEKSGVSKRWMQPLNEVLGVPTWTMHEDLMLDNVLYTHGEGKTARSEIGNNACSVVQGHRHTEGYVWYKRIRESQYFGMQVGTGIDEKTYAFAYAKKHPRPILSCGVVIDGTRAYLEPMTI